MKVSSDFIPTAAGWSLINPTTPSFNHVPMVQPFYQHIETAFCHCVLKVYADGSFRPYNNATRGQVSYVIYRALLVENTCQ